MKGILVLALVGLFLGCALQVAKSRERFQDSFTDEYNELERDGQELTSPDEFDDYEREEDDYDGTDDGDDDNDLDVEVKAADAFDDDDDDDENDEELGEYQR